MGLTLYPTIDLLGGKCMRLRAGSEPYAPTFDADPVEAARRWRDAGASWVHVVDLDGALTGAPQHLPLVEAIARVTELRIQVGGSMRSEQDVASAFDAGAARVILSTAVAREGALLDRCIARWSDSLAVSVDTRGGNLTVAGWLEMPSEPALTFAQRLVNAGIRTLLISNVERDGTLAGTDIAGLIALRADIPNTTLIASGNLSSLDEIRQLARGALDGAVLGRALYDGTLDLREALRAADETQPG